ncbi:hypothetical protein GCM10010343_10210 [Streptomyces avidinii]|nr:hypothetical protein GCM10010343_10210 [Streptomyces avidinii]
MQRTQGDGRTDHNQVEDHRFSRSRMQGPVCRAWTGGTGRQSQLALLRCRILTLQAAARPVKQATPHPFRRAHIPSGPRPPEDLGPNRNSPRGCWPDGVNPGPASRRDSPAKSSLEANLLRPDRVFSEERAWRPT